MKKSLLQGSHILSKKRLLQDLSALLIFALMIFFLLTPSLKDAEKCLLAGGEGDTYMSLMNNLFFSDSLKTGKFFGDYRTNLINQPEGYMIFNWLVDPGCPMLASVLALFIDGHIPVYNIIQLLNLLLLAFFIYRLSRYFYDDFFLSLCAGAAALYSMPFLGASWDGLFDVTFLYLIVILIILHLKFEAKTTKQAALLGCAAATATFFNTTFVYFAMLFIGFDGLADIISRKRVKDTLKYLFIAGLIVGLSVFLRFYFQPRSVDIVNLSDNDYLRTSRDFFKVSKGYSQKQFLSVAPVFYPFDAAGGPEDKMPLSLFDGSCYFGFHLILFGAAGMALLKFREKRKYMYIFILFFIISLGPYFTLSSHVSRIELDGKSFLVLLPFALIVKLIPLLKYVRHISRLSYIIYYFFIIFSVYGAYAAAGRISKDKRIKYSAAAGWTLIHIFSIVIFFPGLTPLHADRKESAPALQMISLEKGACRVGYIDPGLKQAFPRVNNRNLIIFTAAKHKKQSIIMNTESKALMYYCLRDSYMSGESRNLLLEQLKLNSIKYIISFKVTGKNSKDYSATEKEKYFPAIGTNLNRLFKRIYCGFSYDIYNAATLLPGTQAPESSRLP